MSHPRNKSRQPKMQTVFRERTRLRKRVRKHLTGKNVDMRAVTYGKTCARASGAVR